MITLASSYSSLEALAAAYCAQGGVIGSTETFAPSKSSDGTLNCAGTPPTFFDKWTCHATDQLPNLYKRVLNMGEVTAVQAPSQQNGWTPLNVIQGELSGYEFVSAHAAAWYMRPENIAAFLAVCPSGYLVFLEKYRDADRILRVVYLYVKDGRVCVGRDYAVDASGFVAQGWFAVRRKLSV